MCSTSRARGSGRSAARRAGGWRSRCGRCSASLDARGAHAGAAPRPGRRRSSPSWRARPAPSAVYWNEIEIAPHARHRRRSRRGARTTSASRATAIPATCWRAGRRSATRKAAACGCSRRSGSGCWRSAIRRSRCRRRPRSRRRQRSPSDGSRTGQLEPTAPDWAGGLRDELDAGRSRRAGKARATSSPARSPATPTSRDRPDRDGTSRLSPHLRFGEISPRQIWHAARFAAAERPAIAGDVDKFLSELGWREFCRHLLFDHPDLADPQSAAGVRRLPLDAATTRRCAPGSAAAPAIRSSTPGCANSGTPA